MLGVLTMDTVNYFRENRNPNGEPQTMTEKILQEPWAPLYLAPSVMLHICHVCPLCGAIVELGSVKLHGAWHLNQ